jgi:hypothetical protein
MFQRRGTTSPVFPKDKIIGWLSWLAKKMREHSQSVFLVEGFQPSWLATTAQKVTYLTVVILIGGLSGGMIGVLCGGPIGGVVAVLIGGPSAVLSGVLSGVRVFGLMLGLLGALGGVGTLRGSGRNDLDANLFHTSLVETVSWKWNQFWKMAIRGLIFGLSGGLSFALLVWLSGGLSGGLRVVLMCGLIGGVTIGLVDGLVSGFTGKAKDAKATPNQGTKLSLNISLAAFLVASLTVGITFGLICGVTYGPRPGFVGGLSFGLFVGLLVGLHRGGSGVIKHYALRLTLWFNGYTPFKFIKFLDQCAKLIFLKKVGGGYIFVHRMLLEYFADLTPESTKAEKGKTGSVAP